MCGRYALYTPNDIDGRFNIANHLELAPTYNAAPGQELPVIFRNQSHNLVQTMKWGLVPFWAKDAAIGNAMINARAESVTVKPGFRTAFKTRRCLVPANGFFEWNQKKQPYYFHADQLFAFAGIYDIWTDMFGRELYSYTIITTNPNGVVKPVHDRMPVILKAPDEKRWLDPSQLTSTLVKLLDPYPADKLAGYQVSPEVNSPMQNSAAIIKPL